MTNPNGEVKNLIHPLEEGYSALETTFPYKKQPPQDFASYVRIASLKIWLPTGYCFNYTFASKRIDEELHSSVKETMAVISKAFIDRKGGEVIIDRHDVKVAVLVTPPQIQGDS